MNDTRTLPIRRLLCGGTVALLPCVATSAYTGSARAADKTIYVATPGADGSGCSSQPGSCTAAAQPIKMRGRFRLNRITRTTEPED